MEEGEGRRAHSRHPVRGRSAERGWSTRGDGICGVAIERGAGGGEVEMENRN